jgi:hypothetical protein
MGSEHECDVCGSTWVLNMNVMRVAAHVFWTWMWCVWRHMGSEHECDACGSTRILNLNKEIVRERLKQKDGICLQKKKPCYSVIGKFRHNRSRSLQLTSFESDFNLVWLNPLGRKGTVHLVDHAQFSVQSCKNVLDLWPYKWCFRIVYKIMQNWTRYWTNLVHLFLRIYFHIRSQY